MAIHEGHDVLGDLMRGSLDHCVKCTICETFCPVSNVTPLFPGPKYVGPQAERFRVRWVLVVTKMPATEVVEEEEEAAG